jgi:hypothetical protein
LERLEAAASTGELGHIPALVTYVIELQDCEPGLSTIDTSGSGQQIPEVGHIPPFATCKRGVSFGTAVVEPPGTSAYGGPHSMAVDADDFAIGDLALDAMKRDAVTPEHAHICPLYADMVELQDQGIRHAAIATGMGVEMVLNERTALSSAPSKRTGGLVSMEQAPGPEVGPVTVAAPPLAALGVAVEAGKRKLTVATPALPMTQL